MAISLPLTPSSQVKALEEASRQLADRAQALYVSDIVSSEFSRGASQTEGTDLTYAQLVFALETVGFDLDRRARIQDNSVRRDTEFSDDMPWRQLIWRAYRIRRAMNPTSPASGEDHANLINRAFEETLDGVLAHRQPEVRLRLKEIDLTRSPTDLRPWDEEVEYEVKRAFLLSVRKEVNSNDLVECASIIKKLRERQREGEERQLGQLQGDQARMFALRTVALYNCARAVELVNNFLNGEMLSESAKGVTFSKRRLEVERFIFSAREALRGVDPLLLPQVVRFGQALQALLESSVFSLTLPSSVQAFLNRLAVRHDKPVLELWYAQKRAIDSSLLDPTRTAVVVSLPTSSGKTLLAEMAIVQALADNRDRKVIYMAPTRALVTQVGLTLRRDFDGLGITVQIAGTGYEFSAVESEVLLNDFNVLVTTHEKLDLLVKAGHKAVSEISLVVVDEAHNLADEERGSRLELLLGTLRRERERVRFLLLTPFARNASDLAQWLAEGKGAPILIDWQPNDRILAATYHGRKPHGSPVRPLGIITLDSPHSNCPGDQRISLGDIDADSYSTKEGLAVSVTRLWASARRGGVLLLASSRNGAQDRAQALAASRERVVSNGALDLVSRYLFTEAGGNHPMASMLLSGVAFHHAGLSPETRYFVERLVEGGDVSIVCATTTLAQGVHFPLSAAVIEGYTRRVKRRGHFTQVSIKPWEFWNIVGRVGRTLEDQLGVISFVARSDKDVARIKEFIAKDANEVRSSLQMLLEELRGRDIPFDLESIESHRALSAFLQYLLHAVAVNDSEITHGPQLEDVLRGSFAFMKAQQADLTIAEQMIRWARQYLQEVASQKGAALKGYASLADGTGFSSPSVDLIMANWRTRTTLRDWKPENLFPRSGNMSPTLTAAMDTLGRIPEVRLGSEEVGQFSPERIARIASMWVNGESLSSIARREYQGDLLECTKHIHSTLTSLVPWGIRAIERVSFAGRDVQWQDLDMVPSMIVHGVRTPEAVGLRLLNVPRFVAEGLAVKVRDERQPLSDLKSWLERTTDADWNRALPEGAIITGSECRRLWLVLTGKLPWKEIARA